MKYTKLFNNHEEYLAYTASTSFNVPNVSWCIQEEEAHCTPPNICQEEHEYALYGEPSYPSTIEADETMFKIEYEYSDTYTAKTCSTGITYGQDYGYVLISPNETTSARTISGVYHDDFRNIDAPYSLTQKGITITVDDPVISSDGVDITITCATQGADICYQLDSTGGFSLYTGAITMTADTLVEAYATLSGVTSTTVSETCEYTPTHDYSKDYLTLDVLTGGTILWVARNNVAKTISYSTNSGESWTEITASSTGTPINVSAGDKVLLKGSNEQYATGKDAGSGFSGGTAYYNVEGNVMSLIGGDSFTGLTSFNNKSWVFHNLFAHSNAVSAKNLILPVMTLTNCCYRALFSKANNLTEAPELPATTLANSAYTYMFDVTLITKAPDLPAEVVPASCYQGMFQNCSSLNYIKCMATSITASNSTSVWVQNVSPTGTFVKNSNMSSWTTGNNGIPTNWVVRDAGAIVEPTILFDGYDTITMTCETSGADIYYRLNQSGGYSGYTTAITITADTTVEAYSEKDGETSTTVSQSCTYVAFDPFEYSNRNLNSWTYNNQTISVPYSVNAIDGHSSGYATRGEDATPFTFETNFSLREAQPTYLWFEHADQEADIYVGNTKAERHYGGYNAFFSDLTNYVSAGTNSIKVGLFNKKTNNLAPAAGDFNFNATLGYVKLFTSPVLPSMEYGYDGFHITSTVSSAEATINIKTKIPTGASVVCKIDSGNTNIYSATSASTNAEMVFTTTIQNPHLWNGTIDPFMYTVTLEVYHDGDLYHRYVRPYGFRYYEYVINDTVKYGTAGNPYTGFLLNGSPYLLRGVCMHSDKDGKANALTTADIEADFDIIQELGCNFIRLAHYPHPKTVYDICDRMGIVVQTEVPWVNSSSSGMPEVYYERLTGQYDDMVRQHYNHPCIFFWGLANEITPSTVSFTKGKIEQYTAQIKALDSERMVGFVSPMSVNNPTQFDSPNVDWYGYNCYEGWYQNKNTNNPTSALNTRVNNTINNANKAMAFSEYGCGGTPTCHSDDFMTTTTRGNNPRHDIEYMMWLHEGHIAAIKNFPQLMFTSQWQLFDIAVYNRQEGYTVCLDGENTSTDDNLKYLNDKGLVERDHVTKKDTFYLYKAWWNQTDKFVHICQKNYTKMTDRVIKCYTNQATDFVLKVNGTTVETKAATDNILTFTGHTFSSGDVVTVESGNISDTFTFE